MRLRQCWLGYSRCTTKILSAGWPGKWDKVLAVASIKRENRNQVLRHLGRPGPSTLAVVTAIGLGLPLLWALPASAAPLDPGLYLFHGVYDGPLCSAPAAQPGRPGWSEVTCGVGGDEFFVPAGVTVLEVDVMGAAGGTGAQGAVGGGGAEIRASIMVSPGEMLEMTAGGAGGNGNEMGGFNGGGDGPHAFPTPPSPSPDLSGGGGGSSDVRVGETGVWDRIISAAGGGGGGGGEAGGRGGASSAPGQAARLVERAACQPRAPATGRVGGLALAPGAPGTPPPCPVVPAARVRFPPEPQAATVAAGGVATASAGAGPVASAPLAAAVEAALTSSTRSSSARASPSCTLMA